MFKIYFILALVISLIGANNQKVKAYLENAAPYCTDIVAMDQGEVSGGSSWFGTVGHNIRLESELFGKEPTDTIVGRYIYDGYAWRTASVGTPESGDDLIYYVRSYSETKDFAIASGWVYKNLFGQLRTVSCKNTLRIFNREVKNLGSIRLSFPEESISKTITGSYPYIGLAWQPRGLIVWSGTNNGYSPLSKKRSSYPYDNDWYLFGPSIWIRGYTTNISGAWTSSDRLFGRVWYPNALPNRFTFTLTRPIFNTGEGAGAYSDFNFDNIIVYSRSTPTNQVSAIPSMPFPKFKLQPIIPRPSKPVTMVIK